MTSPTIIQTPGAGQFLQQGLESGLQAGLATRKAALEERQVAANEAFRRGYGQYLQSRGEYYQARAGDILKKQQDTQKFVDSIQDPQMKFAAQLALVDPRVAQVVTAQMADKGHRLTFAGNMFVHGGSSWDDALEQAGLPRVGGRLGSLKAPANASQLNAAARLQHDRLVSEANVLKGGITTAEADIARQRNVFGSSTFPKDRAPLNVAAMADSSAQNMWDSLTTSYAQKKWPLLDKQKQRYQEIQAELTGMHMPGDSSTVGMSAPVIPDTFGGGTPSSLDLNRLQDLIQQNADLMDNMQDLQSTGLLSAGPGNQ